MPGRWRLAPVFATSTPEPDRDSVDLRVQAGGPRRPALDLQLKATTSLDQPSDGFLRFRLNIKNYDDLRVATQTPRLLVVLELPRNQSQWMTVTSEELVLRRRAYWLSLREGYDPGSRTGIRHGSPSRQQRLRRQRAANAHGTLPHAGDDLMKVSIRDSDALRAVPPTALAAYAQAGGWRKSDPYGVHSDVYIGEGLPEILVPRTARLADYASVVATLIEIFSQVAEQDELTVYRSLVTADRDVVRLRAGESDDGSLTLRDGIDLVAGAHDLMLSAACSLRKPQAVYRPGANREASDLVNRVRLGQTDQGSFVVTLLTPVVPPPMLELFPNPDDRQAPIERRMTSRLAEALTAAREAAGTSDGSAFAEAVGRGVSANLCEALVRIVEPFPTLDVSVSWARTRPQTVPTTVVRFGRGDAPILREAARLLRERAPPARCASLWFRSPSETRRGRRRRNNPTLRPKSTGNDSQSWRFWSARTTNGRSRPTRTGRWSRVTGDLERAGQRWRLLNPHIEGVLCDDEQ